MLATAAAGALAAMLPAPQARGVLTSVSWNVGTGNWGTAASWNPAQVPNDAGANTFNATISSGTATLDINTDVQDFNLNGSGNLTATLGRTLTVHDVFTLNGGTVSGAANIIADTQVDWLSGQIRGTGSVNATNGFDLSGSGAKRLGDTRTINASSNSFWTGGNVTADAGAFWNNNGQMSVGGTTPLTWSGGVFNNIGNFFETGNTNRVAFTGMFNNSAAVTVLSGDMAFLGGGTHTGNFGALAGLEFEFGGGHNFQAASSINVPLVRFTSGTSTVGGSYSVSGTTTIDSGAVVNFSGLNAATTGTLDLVSAGIGGSGTVAATTVLWKTAAIGGSGLLEAKTTLTISGAGAKSIDGTRIVRNSAAGAWLAGSASIEGNGTFENAAPATFAVQSSDKSFDPRFVNFGVVTKNSGTGTTAFAGTFVNMGTVNANTGPILFAGGGTHTGSFAGTAVAFRGAHSLLAASAVNATNVTIGASGGTTTVNLGGSFTGGTVTVTSAAAFNVNAPATATNFNLASGSLGGTSTLTVGSNLTWSGGAMGDAGTTVSNGAMTFSSASVMTFNGRTIQNNGVANWTTASQLTGSVSSVFNNAGTLNLTTDAVLGVATFNNAATGLLSKSASAGVSTFTGPFNSSGTVRVSTGTIRLTGGGTVSNGVITGGGSGTLEFGGGTFTTLAPMQVPNVVFSGASTTTNINGPYSAASTTVTNGATANFNNVTPSLLGAVNLTGGTIGGSGGLTANAMTWTGGFFGGTGTANVNAGLVISGNGVKGLAGTRNVIVNGGATWSGANLSNSAGSSFIADSVDLQSDSNFLGGRFTAQSLTKSGGNGVSSFTGVYANLSGGTVTVNAGTLSLDGGGTHTGRIQGALGTTMRFGGGVHDFQNSLVITHPNVVIAGGTAIVSLGPVLTMPNLTITSGSLQGGGSVNVTGALNWNSGLMSGGGHTTALGTLSLQSGIAIQGGRTLDLAGSGALVAGGADINNAPSATFNILPGATFEVQAAGNYNGGTVNNSGAFNKGIPALLANYSINAVFNNNGTVNANTGGFFLKGGGTHTGTFNVAVAAGASLEFAGNHDFLAGSVINGPVTFSGGTHTFAGTFNAAGAGTTFSGTSTTVSFFPASTITGTASAIVVNGATVNFDNGEEVVTSGFNMQTGAIGGTTTFSVNNTATWAGGDFKDAGVTNFKGGANMTFSQPVNIGARTINFSSFGSYTGSGSISASAGGLLRVQPGGSFSIGNSTFTTLAVPITNLGTLNKDISSVAEISGPVINSGTMNVNLGTLRLGGGGSSSGRITGSVGQTLQITGGAFDVSGDYAVANTIVSGGLMQLGGTHSSGVDPSFAVINSAALFLLSDAGAVAAHRPSISVQNSGQLSLNSSQHMQGLQMSGSATTTLNFSPVAGQKVVRTDNLGLLDTARINLTNNALIEDYLVNSPLSTVRAQIIAGFNGGTWNGAGINSATAAADSSKAIGYGEASTIFGITVGQTGTFLGQTVDSSTVLVRFTLAGDSTLDGVVDFNDLVKLAQSYNTGGGQKLWTEGDSTYDGVVDFNDLVKLAQNYNTALPAAGAVPGAPAGFEADLAAAFAAAPEPSAGLAVGVAGAISHLTRRRRRPNLTRLA